MEGGKHDFANDGFPAEARYREAENLERSCGTCSHFEDGRCSLYDAEAEAGMTCDSWTAEEIEAKLARALYLTAIATKGILDDVKAAAARNRSAKDS